MLVLATLLFIILSPGILLTLPAGSKGVVMSGQTSAMAVLVHAVLFYILLPLLAPMARRLGLDGFQDTPPPSSEHTKCTDAACGAINLKCCPDGKCGEKC